MTHHPHSDAAAVLVCLIFAVGTISIAAFWAMLILHLRRHVRRSLPRWERRS